MTDVDLQLVREFFELNGFWVHTHWAQHESDAARAEGGAQLYVHNPEPRLIADVGVALHPGDIRCVHRAVVELRAWHADRFYASVIGTNPVVTQFAEPWARGPAKDFFGGEEFQALLVISELPRTLEHRAHAIEAIRESSVDHVIEFPSILQDLSSRVSVNGAYAGSHTLQMLQLLKRYRMLRNQQMEFRFPMEAPESMAFPSMESSVLDDPGESDLPI